MKLGSQEFQVSRNFKNSGNLEFQNSKFLKILKFIPFEI